MLGVRRAVRGPKRARMAPVTHADHARRCLTFQIRKYPYPCCQIILNAACSPIPKILRGSFQIFLCENRPFSQSIRIRDKGTRNWSDRCRFLQFFFKLKGQTLVSTVTPPDTTPTQHWVNRVNIQSLLITNTNRRHGESDIFSDFSSIT